MPDSFWRSQPVARGGDPGIIDTSRRTRDVPTPLPEGLHWCTVDNISEITSFLEKYYVEDITSSYRLSYSADFFRFLFGFPKHKPEYSMGIMHDGRMIGYIMAREHTLVLRESRLSIVSVNFLCLDREYRHRNLAPLMVQEITRIANTNGIFQAIFTAEKDYGFSTARAQYFHYPLNGGSLADADLIDSPLHVPGVSEARSTTRVAETDDMHQIYEMYTSNCRRFMVHEEFEKDAFLWTFTSRDGVICTVFNETEQEFAAFYVVGTRCVSRGCDIKRAYLYYWSGSYSIVSDAIHIASTMGIDMFDVLDLGDNKTLIDSMPFSEGTGSLKYHLYNIREGTIAKDSLSFILF